MAKAVDGLASEAQQRLGTEIFRGLPTVVRNGAGEGTESVLAEMLRRQGLAVSEAEAAFEPEAGAYGGEAQPSTHAHAHAHGHAHAHPHPHR